MRKSLAVLTVFALMLGACGVQGNETKKEEVKEEVAAKKQVTIPSEYLTEEGIVEEWDSTQYTKSEVKDTETVYYMTEAQEKSLLNDTKKNLEVMIKQVADSKKYAAIQKIEQQNDFERLRLYVDKAKYENSDQDALFRTIGLPIIHYQLLKGVKPDALVIECEIWDAQKDEVISVVNLPMDLSNGVLKK